MRLFLFIAEWEGYYYLTIDRQMVRKFKLDRWMALHCTTLTRSRARWFCLWYSLIGPGLLTIKVQLSYSGITSVMFLICFFFFPFSLPIFLFFPFFQEPSLCDMPVLPSPPSLSSPSLSFPRDLIGCGN